MLVKRTNKQKSRKVKKNVNGQVTRVGFGLSAFPRQLINTLRYTDEVSITVTSGFGKYIFSTNGLFDPNFTGAGHQPLYFDQLTAIYDHYTVLSSRIKGQFGNPASITSVVLHSLYIDDDTSTVGDAILASERPDSCFDYVIPSVIKPKLLQRSWNATKVFGPNPMTDPNLQGTSSANPTEQQFYVFQIYDPGLSSFTGKLMVEIEYQTFWDEFVTVSSS